MFEIASGLPPNVMAGIDVTQLGSYLKSHTPSLAGDRYSDKLKDLVSFCLVEDPAKRPIIEEVQHHPYLFNTENTHPTSSLAMLVKAFRVWEAQGGSRKSLFAMGGAQGPMDSDLSSTAMSNDEWNFSTTVDFDQRVMSNTDAQAVYDVYGSQVDLADLGDFTPQASKPKRRRPPPNLPVMRAPLEKVFDPNTVSNYEENARAYYGMPMLPPVPELPSQSDLPLRDNSHNSILRESLIDLDASLQGGRLSKFVDMETIKAGPSRRSRDYDFGGDEYARAPNSDPETVLASSSRKTQEWKFPVMMPQSANPEISHFSFNENNSDPETIPGRSSRKTQEWKFPSVMPQSASNELPNFSFNENSFNEDNTSQPGSARPRLLHHATEPVGFGQEFSSTTNSHLMVPRAASQADNRLSMSSLIDLDESLPEPPPPHPSEIMRPSTAQSDVMSEAGSAFDLEPRSHTSYYPLPSSNREPSIYISDDSDFARRPSIPFIHDVAQRGRTLSAATDAFMMDDAHLYAGGEDYAMMNGGLGPGPKQQSGYYRRDSSTNGSAVGSEYNLTARSSSGRTASMSSVNSLFQPVDGRGMPLLPAPPSERVMMGEGGREMRDEFMRLLEGMTGHLKFTGEYVAELPVRRAGRGQELQNGQSDEYD